MAGSSQPHQVRKRSETGRKHCPVKRIHLVQSDTSAVVRRIALSRYVHPNTRSTIGLILQGQYEQVDVQDCKSARISIRSSRHGVIGPDGTSMVSKNNLGAAKRPDD